MEPFTGAGGAMSNFALRKRLLLLDFHQELRTYLQEQMQAFYDNHSDKIKHIELSIVAGGDDEGEWEGIDIHCCTDDDKIREEFVELLQNGVLDDHMPMVFAALSEPINVGQDGHDHDHDHEDEDEYDGEV